MRYAAIIVTYNRKQLLLRAIQRVLAQSVKPKKVIVIDNNSTDGTEKVIMDSGLINNSIFKYVRLPENVGGSGGFYRGLEIALKLDVDWISLTDDDAIFEPDYFLNIENGIERHPGVKAFSGTIKFPTNEIQLDQRNRINNWNHFSASPVPLSEYTRDFEIDAFTFCGCVINVDLIKQIGLPRFNYFIWYDDIEYSLRIREKSKIINISNAVLIHHTNVQKSKSGYSKDWREYYGVRNRTYTIRELGKNRFWVNVWTVLFYPAMIVRILSKKMYKGFRMHALVVNFVGFRDALINRMGKNSKFLPYK